MRYFLLLILFLVLTAPVRNSFAEIYSWKDANGKLIFSNVPPPEGISASGTWKEQTSPKKSKGNHLEGDQPSVRNETKVRVDGNSIIVPVTFEHKGRQINMNLILDTGASYTVVYLPAAKAHKIDQFVPINIQVANGDVVKAKGLRVKSLRVGPRTQSNAEIVVLNEAGPDIEYQGLLGISFLKHHKYYVDMERSVIVWLSE